MDDDLLYHFNKILLEKREEIIELASRKKREVKKIPDPNKLDRDTNTTVSRIKLEQEKRLKNSAKYKKADAEIK
jgi:RNA polymerase-binding transcription factor DksA